MAAKIHDGCVQASIFFIVATCAFGHALRCLITRFLNRPSIWRAIALECVTTLEWCACQHELVNQYNYFGPNAAAATLFLLSLWSSWSWGEAAGSPFLAIDSLVLERSKLLETTVVTAFQIAGAILAPHYAQYFWKMQPCTARIPRQPKICFSGLATKIHLGAAMTMMAVFLRRSVAHFCRANKLALANLINALVSAGIFLLLKPYTGGHTNPLVVLSMAVKCPPTAPQFLTVYLGGAVLGAILAVLIFHRIYPHLHDE